MSLAVLIAATMLGGAPTGSRINRAEDFEPLDDTRRVGAAFAKCVVRKRKEDVIEYVTYPSPKTTRDKTEKKLLSRVADGFCLTEVTVIYSSIQLRFPGDTLRYIMADELFQRDLKNLPPAESFEGVSELVHPTLDEEEFGGKAGKKYSAEQRAEQESARKSAMARIVLSQFGECVVRSDPKKAHALISTDLVSLAENAALAAIQPTLGGCLPAGQTVTLNKSLVRGAIAYNYYRLWRAAAAPVVMGTGQ